MLTSWLPSENVINAALHNNVYHIITLNNCILNLSCCTAQNFSQLNIDMTEVIIICTVIACIYLKTVLSVPNTAPNCKNLSVIFDNKLSLIKHVNRVVLFSSAQETISVNCLILSGLLSLLSLFYSLFNTSLLCLSQNSSHKLLIKSSPKPTKESRVSRHWLPINFRIDVKILLITIEAHFGLAYEHI